VNGITQHPFIEGLQQGDLILQTCSTCDSVQTGQRSRCYACGGEALTWSPVSPRGTIYAVTTVHRAPTAEFKSLVPYNLCLVSLLQGGRIMGHADAGLPIGAEVAGSARDIAGIRILYFEADEGTIVGHD
jgi:uncharacterized protein